METAGARAQQPERKRRIGVLMATPANDAVAQKRNGAFVQGLTKLGWIDGSTVQIETRWTAAHPDEIRKFSAELVALSPDVILAAGSAPAAALLQVSRTVPIVFVHVPDPVGAGFADSLGRPGGNATGFTNFEYGIGAKWLELLKEVAPRTTRVAVIRDPTLTSGTGQFGAIQSVAPSFGVEVIPVNVREPSEIERTVTAFASSSNGALILTGSPLSVVHRNTVIALAGRHKLPAIYYERFFAVEGGLISYGADLVDQYRHAAGYVDRILKGEKPGSLPVQAPTKYELIINSKTAKALGLTVPPSLLARADEVIE
jgi:putative ABC transport system substrate-binding protein